MPLSKRNTILYCFVVATAAMGCTRTTIEFGTVPEVSNSRLVYIDTVEVRLSTVMADSFVTGNATSFLVGRYSDPYLGIVTAKSFFQVSKPAEVTDIPSNAIYDSLTFTVRLNNYYYGDTTKAQTFYVNELAQAIVTGYADKLYNTSDVPVKPVPLGSKTLFIRPVRDDSIMIRLSDSKGAELFDKLKQQTTDVTSSDNFLNYFKGISLSTGENDTAAIIGLVAADSMHLRVHYHTNAPFNQPYFIDFIPTANQFAFNRIVAYRPNLAFVSGFGGVGETPASKTNNFSFSQQGTGLNLKISFPSLKGILLTKDYVKLLRADLVLRPASQSFDNAKWPLPPKLELSTTDASNVQINVLMDSTGQNILAATPVIDEIYGRDNYYKFNVTSYINQLLLASGNDKALYVQPAFTATAPDVNRLVMESSAHSDYITQLQLSVLIVNK